MSLIVKLIISLVTAVVAFTLSTLLQAGNDINWLMLAAMCLATAATALIVASPASSSAASGAPAPARAAAAKKPSRTTGDAAREEGQVKWFNVSKGFGFITKDDGEEIFVHFRSIRGEGRRGLRDGQRVSFVVAQSDKGPQAEDVEGLG